MINLYKNSFSSLLSIVKIIKNEEGASFSDHNYEDEDSDMSDFD